MATLDPTLEILKHKVRGDFLLLHQAFEKRFGWIVAWGEPERLSDEQMRGHGLQRVLNSLAQFHDRDGDDERKLFKGSKHHKKNELEISFYHVGVTQCSPSQLRLTPMHQGKRGGLVSTLDSVDANIVLLPSSPEAFYDALLQTLRRCS
jgi:hypothetical protein